jgi:hypothetical protein
LPAPGPPRQKSTRACGAPGRSAAAAVAFASKTNHFALCVDISAAVFAYTVRRLTQSGASSVEFDGASSAVRHIYRKEGVGGLFRGCMANNVRAIASALVLYDEGRSTSELGFGCW